MAGTILAILRQTKTSLVVEKAARIQNRAKDSEPI